MKKIRSSWNSQRFAICDLNKSNKAVATQVHHLRSCDLAALYPGAAVKAYNLRSAQIDLIAATHMHDREFILNLRKINACLLKSSSLATCFKFDKWGYPFVIEPTLEHAAALRLAA